MKQPSLIVVTAISGALAVILGAFGAHGIKPLLSPEAYDTWQTASQYHFLHTLGLLVIARLPGEISMRRPAGWWIAGIILFSGSLYILSTKQLHGLEVGFLGPITPIGGLLFIAGWLSLLWPKRLTTQLREE